MKDNRLNLRIDKKTYDMVSILKNKFSINISNLIRTHIQDIYEKHVRASRVRTSRRRDQ
jgi:hypothetical protein